jgi:hypothetical protein
MPALSVSRTPETPALRAGVGEREVRWRNAGAVSGRLHTRDGIGSLLYVHYNAFSVQIVSDAARFI